MREYRAADLIYVNSVGGARALRALAPSSPLLVHVHESDYSLHYTESPGDVSVIVGGQHPIIAASDAVRSTLVDDFDVSPSRVHVIHSFINLPPPPVAAREVQSLRDSLGIPSGAFIVGAVGTIEWRKGPDLFVQLASRLAAVRPDADIHCVWVGAERPTERLERIRVDLDLRKSSAGDRVHFAGAQTNPWVFYHLFDVFALTSRADPFPLVALEAAVTGSPVVCFTGAGGMPEFVADGAGFCVPYLAVADMADRVLELYDDPELRASLGKTGAERVREAYDAATVIPRIAELIAATAR